MLPVHVLSSILNGAIPNSFRAVELQPGQIFQGTVLRLLPDQQALVQLGGIRVIARLQASLQAGDRAWLQVQSGGQPVHLKVLTQTDRHTGKTMPVGDKLADLARALGIDGASRHPRLLQRLLQEKLPLDRQMMGVLVNLLDEQSGGAWERELLDSTVIALRRGFPVTREILLGLRAFLFGPGFSELAGRLRGELDSFLQAGRAAASHIPESEQALREILAKVAEKLGHLQFVDPGRLDGESLKSRLADLGLMWERALLEGERLHAEGDQLKPLLLKAKEQLQDQPLSGKILPLAEKLLQHLTGQQLALTPTDLPVQQLVLQIPFSALTHHDGFVQIEGQKRGPNEIDPDNCRLLFYLQLTHLGEVVIEVSVVNRIVGVEIHGQHPQLAAFSPIFREDLAEGLQRSGYTLSSLKTGEKDAGPNPASSYRRAMLSPYKGVDIRI